MTCPSCGGRGRLPKERRITSGGTRKTLPTTDCGRCNATGQLPDDESRHQKLGGEQS